MLNVAVDVGSSDAVSVTVADRPSSDSDAERDSVSGPDSVSVTLAESLSDMVFVDVWLIDNSSVSELLIVSLGVWLPIDGVADSSSVSDIEVVKVTSDVAVRLSVCVSEGVIVSSSDNVRV